jgi:hypothetical protein
VGLMVCGVCDEVHSLAERHVVSKQCSAHVGQQTFRHVSNSRWYISAWFGGNIVLGSNVSRNTAGPVGILNASCVYSCLSNRFCAKTSKMFCDANSSTVSFKFPQLFSTSTRVCVI